MDTGKPLAIQDWWQQAVALRGSVLMDTLPKALWFGLWGGIIAALYQSGVSQLNIPLLSTLIPNLVLGLLLVFRTNTAYERYWEGRKAWGGIVSAIRNLARTLTVAIETPHPEDRQGRREALHWLVAFALATKAYLRQESPESELAPYLSAEQWAALSSVRRPPLRIVHWLSLYLQERARQGVLHVEQLVTAQSRLDELVANFTACERIQRTPIPLAYSIHLKQLLLVYCFSLPFQVVATFLWLTPLMVALISFTILGVEEIGLQIEDPFGRDPNDLPLDGLCTMLTEEIEALL